MFIITDDEKSSVNTRVFWTNFQCPVCLAPVELTTTAPAPAVHFLSELKKFFERE